MMTMCGITWLIARISCQHLSRRVMSYDGDVMLDPKTSPLGGG